MGLNSKNPVDDELAGRFERWLRTNVWTTLPRAARKPNSKEEEEDLLGYGQHGV